jgi:DNA-binding CsgD family transcriptional regulator
MSAEDHRELNPLVSVSDRLSLVLRIPDCGLTAYCGLGEEGVMVARVTITEGDLRTLLGIVSKDRSDLPSEGLPLSLLADLLDQVGCDFVSFYGLDTDRQMTWFHQDFPASCGDDETYEQAFWAHYWDFAPFSYPDRSGDLRTVTKTSDFYTARQLHHTGSYSDYIHPLGLEHAVKLCLPAGPRRTVRLGFFRDSGPDFSERDRGLLALLRPHLHQAYVDAERRRRHRQLTPRQRDLLRLVAAGHTNAQIARCLGISKATVRTHLENIYTRLRVSSRTAAVTHAFPETAVILARAAGSD